MKTVKALVRAHLRKTGRQRGTKEAQIISRIESHIEAIIADVMALSQHTKNRIAAHKAHRTMAKRGKAILPQRTQRTQRKPSD